MTDSALLSFILLGLSICAVWIRGIAIGGQGVVIPAWLPLFLVAVGTAFMSHIIDWRAIIALAALAGICTWSMRESRPILSDLLAGVAALLALALALHVLPGFDNPVVVSQVHLSGKAAPFTQYANFDKGSAGLLLLAFYCRRAATLSEWRSVLTTTALAAIATGTAVIACALAIGYAAPEAKLPAFALTFLSVNLLFTCVAEEAFFRGLLQERMTRTIAAYPMLRWVPIVASATVFGAAHFAGGPSLVVLATIGGIGYSLAYAATRRVEAAILTHFGANAIHFFGFTYPHLQA